MEAIDTPDTLPQTSADLLDSLEAHPDAVSWLNAVLPVKDDTTADSAAALERRVAALLGALELAGEDTAGAAARLVDDIARGAARLTYDVHIMRAGAGALQGALGSVEARAAAAGGGATRDALARLAVLEATRANMAAAREVLREAEAWGALESDVGGLLGEGAYERAAERLSEAARSMVVFENTPEFESRRALMVSLQNQLEAALSSALVAAVNSQDVAVCRNYFSIFANIQRESEFRNYYYGSRKAGLLELWQNAHLKDCGQDADAQHTFAQFLTTFYTSFLNVLSTERTSISAIFPDPQTTLSALITSTLASLQPSFTDRLSASATHHGARALPQLIAAYTATLDFAAATDKILEKISFAAPAPEPTDAPRTHLRRRSSARMSVSRRHRASISGFAIPEGAAWDGELVQPFVEFQAEYGRWERRMLEDALHGIMAEGPNGDRARVMRERSVDVFAAAEEAIARCNAFTHGYASLGLVDALEGLFTAFIDTSKDEIAAPQTAQAPAPAASGDLADMDYTPADWAAIQSLLHALEAARALHARTTAFETRLRSALAHTAHTLRNAPPSRTTRALAQSTLNGAPLHTLLDRAEPDPFLASPPTDRRPSQQPLLPLSRSALSALAAACQRALQDTILAPLRGRLAGYAALPLWGAAEPSKRGGVHDAAVPSFSLSPSAPVQRVAEGLLNLPRLFEVYAADDALAFSLRTLPYADPVLLAALSAPPPTPEGAHRRSTSLALKPQQQAEQQLAPEAVEAAWLAALARALVAELTGRVLPSIASLSTRGAAQLAADLGYLARIAGALGVEDKVLGAWRAAVEAEDASAGGEGEEGEVWGRVARMRGWTA